LKVGMAEADFSSKNLGVGGAIITAAWISHKDKGSLTSLNLSSNNLTAGPPFYMAGNMLGPHDVITRYTNSQRVTPFLQVSRPLPRPSPTIYCL
jgi:hypothetical protein